MTTYRRRSRNPIARVFRWSFETGWQLADRYQQPRYVIAPPDPLIEKLGTARVWTGLALIVLLEVRYGGTDSFFGRLAEVPVRIMVLSLLAVPVSLVVLGVFAGLARPEARPATFAALKAPLAAVGAFVGVCAGFVSAQFVLEPVLTTVPILAFPMLAVTPMVVVLLLRSAFLVSKYWFRGVDGHPLLAPVIAVVMVVVMAVVELANREPDSLPLPIQLLELTGSVLSVTGLAVLEIRRARQIYRVTFRDGPYPMRYV